VRARSDYGFSLRQAVYKDVQKAAEEKTEDGEDDGPESSELLKGFTHSQHFGCFSGRKSIV
jgi:hypothetical protein